MRLSGLHFWLVLFSKKSTIRVLQLLLYLVVPMLRTVQFELWFPLSVRCETKAGLLYFWLLGVLLILYTPSLKLLQFPVALCHGDVSQCL